MQLGITWWGGHGLDGNVNGLVAMGQRATGGTQGETGSQLVPPSGQNARETFPGFMHGLGALRVTIRQPCVP